MGNSLSNKDAAAGRVDRLRIRLLRRDKGLFMLVVFLHLQGLVLVVLSCMVIGWASKYVVAIVRFLEIRGDMRVGPRE